MEDWVYAVIVIAVIIIIAFLLVGCFVNGGGNADEPNVFEVTSERLICTKSGFDAILEDWQNNGTVLKYSGEKRASVRELTRGEKYYFVYGFRLFDNSAEMDKRAIKNIFEFAIEGADGVYFGADAVSFGSMSFGGDVISVSFDPRSGELDIEYGGENRVIETYIAIEFTPEHSGLLRVESLVYGDEYGNLEFDAYKTPDILVSANVTEKDMLGTDGGRINVTGISCGLVSYDTYRGGIDGMDSFGQITEMVSGVNYLVVDFGLEAENTVLGNICFGVYFRGADSESITLEEANTGEFSVKNIGGGVLINLTHDTAINGKKRVRAVIRVEADEDSYFDTDIFVFSGDTEILGSAYKHVNPSGRGVAKLSLIADSRMMYAVNGYSGETAETVIIPDRYNGLPITEIYKSVFNGSGIKRLETGRYVEKIEAESFRNCASLTEINLGNVSLIGERAFESCASLRRVYFSKSLARIHIDAFSKCNSLEEAHFAEKNGWTAADPAYGDSYAPYLGNASEAASYLSSVYSGCYWSRSDVLSVTDFKISFADTGADTESGLDFENICPYIPGEWECALETDIDGTCLVVIDFDINTVFTERPSSMTEWCIRAETTYGSRISFSHASDDTFLHIESMGDCDCGVWYGLEGQAGDSSDIRIFYEFIPYHNGNYDTLDFTVDIIGAEMEYNMTWSVKLSF